jgi:hypothetical protein
VPIFFVGAAVLFSNTLQCKQDTSNAFVDYNEILLSFFVAIDFSLVLWDDMGDEVVHFCDERK